VGNWVTAYRKDGLRGVKEKPQPGNHHKLTKKQKQTIKKLGTTKTPEELPLEGRFWSTEQLARLVKKEFSVTYRSPIIACLPFVALRIISLTEYTSDKH
jgi:transposase